MRAVLAERGVPEMSRGGRGEATQRQKGSSLLTRHPRRTDAGDEPPRRGGFSPRARGGTSSARGAEASPCRPFLGGLAWIACLLVVGCSSVGLSNRMRDLADVATLSCGYGLGARARVGPLGTGLFANRDLGGLRGGDARLWGGNPNGSFLTDVDLLLYRMEVFPAPGDAVERRGKDFMAIGLGPWTRTFVLPFGRDRPPPTLYTQIEVAVGCGPSVRLGLNPGEMVDFLLGFLGLDLVGDDLQPPREFPPLP